MNARVMIVIIVGSFLSGLLYAGNVDLNAIANTGYLDGLNSGKYNTLNQVKIKEGKLKPLCLFGLKGNPKTNEEVTIFKIYTKYYKIGYAAGVNLVITQQAMQQQQMQQQIQQQQMQQIQQQQQQQVMQQQQQMIRR